MASLHTLERRILALEVRLAEIEDRYRDTLYKLYRSGVKTDLRLAKVLGHFKIADVTHEEVTRQADGVRTAATAVRAECDHTEQRGRSWLPSELRVGR